MNRRLLGPEIGEPLFIDANIANDPRMCQDAFLQNIREVKTQIRSAVNSLVVVLKEREEELCHDVEDYCLKVSNSWKASSKHCPRLSGFHTCNCKMCYAPFRLRFDSEGDHNLRVNLQRFGGIHVDTLQTPNKWNDWGPKQEVPLSSRQSASSQTSPADSTSSSQSFQLLSMEEECLKNDEHLLEGFEYMVDASTVDLPLDWHPVTMLGHQLGQFLRPKPPTNSMRRRENPNPNSVMATPSSVIKETFHQFLQLNDQEKWLSNKSK